MIYQKKSKFPAHESFIYVVLPNIFVEIVIYFKILWWIENSTLLKTDFRVQVFENDTISSSQCKYKNVNL